MNRKVLLFFLPLLGFVGLAVIFLQALDNDPSRLPSVKLGKTLPAFELSSLHDENSRLTSKNIQGPALLNVWATWCPSCQVEHPMLVELSKNGIPIYGLNYKDARSAAIQYLQLHGNPYREVVFDPDGDLGLDLGVYGAPETFLIDGQGIIQYRHVGVIDETSWLKIIWPRWQAMGGFNPAAAAKKGGSK